ncbi:GNAT family N-acetyltransferase [Nocardiopsis sp. CNT-189]|uniref:GNAT family N-acetyltransferase n=1 Tax=Nocardiopsis oceanisediminis TaxID=2816862 RepID=UPI003B3B4528
MDELREVTGTDLDDLTAFLTGADLTLSGLDSPEVALWIARDADGRIYASTGFEAGGDGRDVLLRSVAVRPDARRSGLGGRLAEYAVRRAAERGAERAWLFSRRSGPFWRKLGFTPADRGEMARVLASTHQVRLFARTGQLAEEVAWSRRLG